VVPGPRDGRPHAAPGGQVVTRHPLMAAAERAVEDGATVAVVIYMDGNGALGVMPVGDEPSPYVWLGMIARAAQILMEPSSET